MVNVQRALGIFGVLVALGCGSASHGNTDAAGGGGHGGSVGTGGRGGGAGGAVGTGGAIGGGGTIGTGGAVGTGGASGNGGATGTGGTTGTGGAPTGIVLRGGITTLGRSQSGAVLLSKQHISVRGGPICSASICVSGGITP